MSFKDGIPLLKTLDDDEDEPEEDFSVEVSTSTRSRFGRKHLYFGVLVALAVAVLVVVVVAVAVPVALLQRPHKAGNAAVGGSPSVTQSTSPLHPSSTLPSLFLSSSSRVPVPMPSPSLMPSSSQPSSASPSQTSQPMPTPTTSATTTPTPTPQPPSSCDSLNSCKPRLDNRTYQVLTLDNSLRVLLISDPKSNVSAASMEVAAGSFSDPPEAEGLAHFCEHMLFLGTEKYPDQHVYSNFLSTHGGGDNAFTSTQETNYYFNVNSDYLEQALDLFAQFFIGPLFSASSVQDEVHAVNSEHEKNLQSDGWKLWQLLKHVSNPEHPFHMFSTGTLSTLNNSRVDLLQLLHEYYNSSYSANTMQLVVYGKDPIPILANWTTAYFSDVPNRSISPLTFSTTAFPPDYSGKLVYHYPVADTNTISIFWQTQPLESLYRNDVTEFLSRYLGHEGPGSILYYLKQGNWANSLSAGSEVDADSFSLLVVSIELTEEGLSHVSEVVASVFQYIRLLSGQSDSDLQSMWSDYVSVSQVVYDYSEQDSPSDYAQTLAEAMRLVTDPEDFLGSPERRLLNTSLVRQVLTSLSPENSLVFIGTHHLNIEDVFPLVSTPNQTSPVNLPWPVLNETEPIYTTPYALMDTPHSVVQYWGSNDTAGLWLPGENQFVPQDFAILSAPQDAKDTPQMVDLNNAGEGVSLWWLQDTRFKIPRVNMHCSIESLRAERSPRWMDLTVLYINLVAEALTPALYPAAELSYSASLSATPRGLTLSVSGFSDPNVMEIFLNAALSQLRNVSSMSHLFDHIRETRQQYLTNYGLTTLPYRYIYQYLQPVVMERPYWKHQQLLDETHSVSFGDVVAHVDELFSNASVICFAHGNIAKNQAIHYTQLVVQNLSPSSLPHTSPHGAFLRDRVQLTAVGNYSVTLATLNSNDHNSAVNAIYQVGPTCSGSTNCSSESLKVAAHLGLLDQIIADFCFYQLRTVEQLGYVVFCFQTSTEGVGSFQVVVQSEEYSAPYVLGEIDKFLIGFSDNIANMTASEWSTQKELYKTTLKQKEQTLTEESDLLWQEIITGREQFDYQQQLVGVLPTITLESLQQFYSTHITNSSEYRKMVIGVYGQGSSADFTDAKFMYCLSYNELNQTALEYPSGDDNCA